MQSEIIANSGKREGGKLSFRTTGFILVIYGLLSAVLAVCAGLLDATVPVGMLLLLWAMAWLAHVVLLFLIPRYFSLGTAILIAMGCGIAVGGVTGKSVFGRFLADWLNLYGVVFLRLLVMVVPVLILISITRGVASLGDPVALGRLGFKTVAFYLMTTVIAVFIGLLCVNVMHPGKKLAESITVSNPAPESEDSGAPGDKAAAASQTQGTYGQRLQKEVIPALIKSPFLDGINPLTIILFALLLGAAIGSLGPKGTPLLDVVQSLDDALVRMILWFMKLAPMAVFTLMAKATGEFGGAYLQTLAYYVFTVLSGLVIHFFILACVIVPLMGRISPVRFFRAMSPALSLGFGISSSSATLPLTIHCANRRLGVDRSVCEFMLPVGATVNMDGTALYQAVAVMFLAFANGLESTLSQQIFVFAGAVLVSIGTAGIPGGSIALMPVTLGLLGLGPEVIGLIIGVDRLLDMCRTVVNITGDVAGCAVVARSEGKLSCGEDTAHSMDLVS